MRNSSLLLIIAICILSCGKSNVYERYEPIENYAWHKDSIINFKFIPKDTISKNNLYVNLRNNKDYAYSNLFLIVGIDFPNNTNIIDTLEYEMANAEGKFLGSGFTDLKENKLEYKTKVVFPSSGEYNINVQHAMRKSGDVDGIINLKGITEVGLSIEKAKPNE